MGSQPAVCNGARSGASPPLGRRLCGPRTWSPCGRRRRAGRRRRRSCGWRTCTAPRSCQRAGQLVPPASVHRKCTGGGVPVCTGGGGAGLAGVHGTPLKRRSARFGLTAASLHEKQEASKPRFRLGVVGPVHRGTCGASAMGPDRDLGGSRTRDPGFRGPLGASEPGPTTTCATTEPQLRMTSCDR